MSLLQKMRYFIFSLFCFSLTACIKESLAGKPNIGNICDAIFTIHSFVQCTFWLMTKISSWAPYMFNQSYAHLLLNKVLCLKMHTWQLQSAALLGKNHWLYVHYGTFIAWFLGWCAMFRGGIPYSIKVCIKVTWQICQFMQKLLFPFFYSVLLMTSITCLILHTYMDAS